jgi:hypothetical protein
LTGNQKDLGKMKVFALFSVFILSSVAQAFLDSIEKIDTTLDRFVQQIQASHIKEAVDILVPHWPLDRSEMDAFASKTKDSLPTISARFGKSLGFEKFRSCKVGNSIYKTQYLQKFEKSFVVWSFDFNNSGSGWIDYLLPQIYSLW